MAKWEVTLSGAYRCERCGDYMLALQRVEGTVVLAEIPLLCANLKCTTLSDLFAARAVIRTYTTIPEDVAVWGKLLNMLHPRLGRLIYETPLARLLPE